MRPRNEPRYMVEIHDVSTTETILSAIHTSILKTAQSRLVRDGEIYSTVKLSTFGEKLRRSAFSLHDGSVLVTTSLMLRVTLF